MRRRLILSILLALLAGGLILVGTILRMGSGGEEKIGFVEAVTTNGNYGILFDEAEWLTGEEGEQAAIAAGLCTERTRSECLPNDYIIRNASSVSRSLEFATGVTIAMQTLTMEQDGVRRAEISRQEFEQLINGRVRHWKDLPYRITIKNGLVTSVEEIYVP